MQRLCLLFLVFVVLCLVNDCARRVSRSPNTVISNLSDTYTSKAESLAKEAQYRDANFYLYKAVLLHKKTGDWEKMVRCYIKIGNNYRETDDYEKALENLNQALKLALNNLEQKPLDLAKSFIKLAFKYFHHKKNYELALELYQKALDIETEVLGKDHPEVARIYNSMALVCWNKGEAQKAVNYYNKSFLIKLKQLKNSRTELVQVYKFLDQETVAKGTFDQAQDYFKTTLAQHVETYGHNHPLVATIHEGIGILHAYEGLYVKAMQHLRKSLSIRLNVFGSNHLSTASSYHNIGVCLRLQGEYNQALTFLNDALAIKSNQLGEDQPGTADTFYQMGNIYYKLSQFDHALQYFQLSLAAMVPEFSAADIYTNPEITRLQAKDNLLKALAAKAQALKMCYLVDPSRLDDLHLSMATYLLTCRLIDHIRSGYKSESYKMFFGEKCLEIYGQALETALKLYDVSGNAEFKQQAFILSEKSKAAVLAEAVSESLAKKFADIPAYLLEREKSLKMELALYETYLEKESQKGDSPDMSRTGNIEEYYFKLREEYRNLIDHFEKNYEKYYNLKYKSRLLSIPDIQATLAEDAALIEYFIANQRIYIFVLTRETLDVVSRPLADDFYNTLVAFYNSIKKIEEKSCLNLSLQLNQVLIEPVTPYFKDKKRLIIIPHGHLYYIPFEALAAGPAAGTDFSGVDFLINHYSFNYHYSANLWLHNVRNKTGSKDKSFIGFAPVFSETGDKGYILTAPTRLPDQDQDSTGSRDIILDDTKTRFSELPATEDELRGIIELFRKIDKKAAGYFYQQATEDVFKNPGMKNYSFIHVATHSLKSQGGADLSGLIFSRPADASHKEDGILYSEEIYNLNLNARLVVLSSCESGIGKLVKGEGMIALARGFFYAGVQNIIFSLWKVEDKSTSRLMIELYRSILADKSLPDALRQAKISLIKDRFTAFPKYWSGFILVGE